MASFDDAVAWLSSTPAAASLPTDTKLELYGIFKLVTTGAGPTTPRPGMFAFEAKAKYDAWAAASTKYPEMDDARARYVEIAESIGFDAASSSASDGKTGMGPSVSVMTAEDEGAVLVLDPSLLNAKDEFGFTALHLAADRGHAPAVAYLLSLGADKTILDPDEQTALEIATISGRDDVVELLQ